ncbi:hypothetical protein ACR6A7_11500 [Pantoea sp. RRHST58]|uniref:hypothetical protein n=1 Tax=Pantoea sp. RRHST58 TaxID=3425183 RepID=UPI003DA0918A
MPKWQYQPVTTHADHSFDFVGVAAPSPFKLFIIQLFFENCCATQHVYPLAAAFLSPLAETERSLH